MAPVVLTALSTVANTPRWTFGGRLNPLKVDSAPGPGTYECNNSAVLTASPKFAFSGGSKETNVRSLSPGPATYSISPRGDTPSWTFTSKATTTTRAASPGPGVYNPNYSNVAVAAPKFGFGNASRRSMSSPGSPGPGTYTAAVPGSSPKWSWGGAARIEPLRTGGVGPGQYAFTSTLSGPKYTLGGRCKQLSKLAVPGPGTYDARPTTATGIKYSFGNKGGDTVDLQKSSTPGPGTYSATLTPQSPRWGFSSASKTTTTNISSPGPGQYEIKTNPSSPRWVISSSSTRAPDARPRSPGPGAYNAATPAWNGPKFSMLGKEQPHSRAQSPGPGEYSPSNPSQTTVKFSFPGMQRSVLAPLKKSPLPGPGAYDATVASSSPSWTMHSRGITGMASGAGTDRKGYSEMYTCFK